MANKSGKNTEERILNAAIEVFCRDGIQGARMQDIADLAHINRAMLHYYFRDKKSLSHDTIERITLKFREQVHKTIDADIPIDEKLSLYIEEMINIYSENIELMLFVLHESVRDKELISKIFENPFRGKNTFFDQLKLAVDKGSIKPFTKEEFVVFISSLCAFPFLAGTLFKVIFEFKEEQWNFFLEQYKKRLPELIKRSIYVNYDK